MMSRLITCATAGFALVALARVFTAPRDAFLARRFGAAFPFDVAIFGFFARATITSQATRTNISIG
jgi:hypothetical protein